MKRFSDTARFDEPWFQSLPLEMKLAWEYVWAKCDNAGVWMANTALAEFQIGKKIDWEKLIECSQGRLVKVGETKIAIVGFVAFQCGKLNPNCRPHAAVISLLETHGMIESDTLSIVYPKGIYTLKDKDKDQDKEKDTPAVVKKTAVLSLVEFDRFWSIYPRKVGKEEARKAWMKAGVTFEQCEATIRTWAASEDWQKDGGRFCPHASTWLNQKRWSDSPPLQCQSEPKPKTEFWTAVKTETVMEIMERQERERLEALENQYAEDGL
jgi:hypothetical protein